MIRIISVALLQRMVFVQFSEPLINSAITK
jgi:hypothetical protein